MSDLFANNQSRFSVEKDDVYEQAVARGVAEQLRTEKKHKSRSIPLPPSAVPPLEEEKEKEEEEHEESQRQQEQEEEDDDGGEEEENDLFSHERSTPLLLGAGSSVPIPGVNDLLRHAAAADATATSQRRTRTKL